MNIRTESFEMEVVGKRQSNEHWLFGQSHYLQLRCVDARTKNTPFWMVVHERCVDLAIYYNFNIGDVIGYPMYSHDGTSWTSNRNDAEERAREAAEQLRRYNRWYRKFGRRVKNIWNKRIG